MMKLSYFAYQSTEKSLTRPEKYENHLGTVKIIQIIHAWS